MSDARPAICYTRDCLDEDALGSVVMLKKKWIPTPLVVDRQRPEIAPIEKPRRMRPLFLGVTLTGMLLRLFWLKLKRDDTPEQHAMLIRSTLEQLGGVWVKVGQLLGMRRDLFAPEFCDILSTLQDHATGFDYDYTRQIIEEDLGRPIGAVFSSFEEAPFAAASIGQIHRAVLRREGVEVAVKIRRPTIAETMLADIRFVSFICNTMRRLRLLPSFRWDDFQRELGRTLGDELDYRFEATAIRDMRKLLKQHKIYAPKVFRDYLSDRMLVMEFIRGALMSDVLRLDNRDPVRLEHWLAENDIDREKVGKKLFMSMARQLYEDNYFHGDLHPGNIVLLRDNKIALIDFGSVGWLEADFLRQYNDMQEAMGRQQYAKAADVFLLLGPELPHIDIEPCKAELADFLRLWSQRARTPELPYSERSMGYALAEMVQILNRYYIPSAWAFLRVNRAQLTLDASLRALDHDLNYFSMMRKYNKQANRRKLKRGLQPANIGRQLSELAIGLPELVQEGIERGFYELEHARKRARHFQGSIENAAYVGSMVLAGLGFIAVVGVLGLVGVYLRQSGHELPVSAQLTEMLDRAPAVPRELWYVIWVFAAMSLWWTWRARRKLRQPDIDIVRPRD